MADNKLNTQLQAIQARLDRIDDDFIANYAGISELVAGLAKNPITAGSVVKSLKTYNFSPSGQKLQKALLGLIPGVSTFRKLQHLDTSAALDSIGSRVSEAASSMAETVAGELEAAATQQLKAIEDQANALVEQVSATKLKDVAESVLNDATQKLETAISEGASEAVIAELEAAVGTATSSFAQAEEQLGSAIAALAGADAALAQVNAVIDGLNQAVSAVTGILGTFGEIADGKTDSAIVRGTPPNTKPDPQKVASDVVGKLV